MFKIIAAILMLIDHIFHIFSPYISQDFYTIGRSIGRLAFPMFAYALARGFNRTSNRYQYCIRLILFAIFTQLLFYISTQYLQLPHLYFYNVIITFSLANIILIGIHFIQHASLDMMIQLKPVISEGEVTKSFSPGGVRIPSFLGQILGFILVIIAVYITIRLNPDYGIFGVATVILFQRIDYELTDYEKHMRKDLKRKRWGLYFLFYSLLTFAYCASNVKAYGNQFFAWIEMLSIPAILLFPIYERDKKPKTFGKFFFYFFYPLHYVALMLVRYFLQK